MKNRKIYSFAVLSLLTLNVRGDVMLKNASSEGRTGIKDRIEQRVTEKMEQKIESRGLLMNVKVTAKDATSVTVDNNGTAVKVNITTSTQFRRKFWGKSSLAEINVNDMISVIGKWTDDTQTTLGARLIRNLSVQKRHGVFFGEIKSLSAEGFVITTLNREDQTVTTGAANLINRRQQVITKADLQVGHKVRVRGLWDSANKTITEVTEIKDFSLPVKSSVTPVSTATP